MFVECLLCTGTESTTWNRRVKTPALKDLVSSRENSRDLLTPRGGPGKDNFNSPPCLGTAAQLLGAPICPGGKEPEAPLASLQGKARRAQPVYFHF